MVITRALRYNGEWEVAKISILMFLYGKFWLWYSKDFCDGAQMKEIHLVWPWEYKYLVTVED